MSTTTSTIFSGNSRYASDFSTIIERAVAIASLPLTQLQNQKTSLDSQATALSALQAKFSALQTTLDSVGSAMGTSSYTATVDDETVARSRVTGSVLAGVYQIETVSLGSYAVTMSRDGLGKVTDPGAQSLSTSSALTLTVNGETYEIQPEENTLDSLVSAINQSGAGVRAVIVNMGTAASPDYRLSVQGEKLAAMDIQLNDGGQDLLESLAPGSNVEYRLNGTTGATITSDSLTVTVAPGLSLDLEGIGTTTVTVGRSAEPLGEALSAFASAYNAAATLLETHRGDGGGALAGNSLISSLSQVLSRMASYADSTGTGWSLESLGLELSKTGQISFNQTAFDQAASDDVDGLLSFLGKTGQGGFLDAVSSLMKQATGDDSSMLDVAISTTNDSIDAQEDLISRNEERISLLQDNLYARMAKADALIATLEQQVVYMEGLFEAMKESND